MADDVAAASTEAAPVVEQQPAAQPAATERPNPTLETTFYGIDWGTVPEETRKALQEETDRRIKRAKDNASYRTRKEIEAYYKGRESVKPEPAAPAPKVEPAPEDNPPERAQFDTYEAFIEAKAEYRAGKAADAKIEAREKAATETAAREAAQKAATEFQGKVRAKYPDIDARLAEVGDQPIHRSVQDAISESEFGADIFNEVITKPGELERLYKLSPTAAVKEIGRLEARYEATQKPAADGSNGSNGSTSNPGAKPAAAPAKPSAAPAPIEPVGGKAVSGDAEPSHNDPAAWAAWRNRQVLARRKGPSARA